MRVVFKQRFSFISTLLNQFELMKHNEWTLPEAVTNFLHRFPSIRLRKPPEGLAPKAKKKKFF